MLLRPLRRSLVSSMVDTISSTPLVSTEADRAHSGGALLPEDTASGWGNEFDVAGLPNCNWGANLTGSPPWDNVTLVADP
jgi:hypothetical protein